MKRDHNSKSVPKPSVQQENIDRESVVVYNVQTITVIKHGKVILTFTGITSLHTYNEFDGVKSFYKITQKRTFRGFGESWNHDMINNIIIYF